MKIRYFDVVFSIQTLKIQKMRNISGNKRSNILKLLMLINVKEIHYPVYITYCNGNC